MKHEFFVKYNVTGPRYTSYPTVPYWDHSPTSDEWISALKNSIEILDMKTSVANIFGQIKTHLELKGKIIGVNDLWIASHALDLGLTVVTNNIREFSRVPKLKIENWTE